MDLYYSNSQTRILKDLTNLMTHEQETGTGITAEFDFSTSSSRAEQTRGGRNSYAPHYGRTGAAVRYLQLALAPSRYTKETRPSARMESDADSAINLVNPFLIIRQHFHRK